MPSFLKPEFLSASELLSVIEENIPSYRQFSDEELLLSAQKSQRLLNVLNDPEILDTLKKKVNDTTLIEDGTMQDSLLISAASIIRVSQEDGREPQLKDAVRATFSADLYTKLDQMAKSGIVPNLQNGPT